MESFNSQYKIALYKLNTRGRAIKTRGTSSLEILFHRFCIMPFDNVIRIEGFETKVDYAKEELAWYLSKDNKIGFSNIIFNTWRRFSDDGFTANSGYGKRIFGEQTAKLTKDSPFISQWEWVIGKLNNDRQSRQCVINVNRASDKDTPGTLDFPCTISFQVFIRDEKLYWITTMRSQDIVLGTRNDVYCFTELQKLMAQELNVGLGEYVHDSHSLHIYENHWEKMKKLFI